MIPFPPIAFAPMEPADWFLLGGVLAVVLMAIWWLLVGWITRKK